MNVENAYRQLAQAVVSFCADSEWDSAGTKTSIFSKMTESNYWRRLGEEITENDRFPPFEIGSEASRAALFLRDNLQKTTGQRIWGITFTLYPDGKFNIEYDYTKPEEYDLADEQEPPLALADALEKLTATGMQVDSSALVDTTPEQQFLDQALAQLQKQTAQNSTSWGLGEETQWNLDMNAGTLRFGFANGRALDALVQVVGTYNTKDDTFLWGWDHPSVPAPLRRAAQCVHDYGAERNIKQFTARTISCSQDQAWKLTAAAAYLDGATGAYRGEDHGTWVYMTFQLPAASEIADLIG
jgi:hypothetical protein